MTTLLNNDMETLKERINEVFNNRNSRIKNNIISIHVLRQNGSSCQNRGMNGEIKECTFNGESRQMISSAALKNGQKEYLYHVYGEELVDGCIDTRRIGIKVLEYLEPLYSNDLTKDEKNNVLKVFKQLFGKEDKGDSKKGSADYDITTKETVRFSVGEVKYMVENFVEYFPSTEDFENKDKIKEFVEVVDKELEKGQKLGHMMCLIGRLTTNMLPTVNSAISVANALSTGKRGFNANYFSRREMVMNNKIDGSKYGGAAILGDSEIESSVMYETYAIDIEQFISNEMEFNGIETREEAIEIAKEILPKYIEAIFFANATGKQNTDLSKNAASLMYVTVGRFAPTYHNAFSETSRTKVEAVNKFVETAILYPCMGDLVGNGKLFVEHNLLDKLPEDVVATYKCADMFDFVKENIGK